MVLHKDTLCSIILRSLESLKLFLDRNEEMLLYKLEDGCNSSLHNKVKRDGVGDLVYNCAGYFNTDTYLQCIACNRYNIYDPCLSNEYMLCFCCLEMKRYLHSEENVQDLIGSDGGSNKDDIKCCSVHENAMILGVHSILSHADMIEKNFIIKQFVHVECRKYLKFFCVG